MTTDTVSKRGKKQGRLDSTAQSCALVVLSSVQICSAQLGMGFHWASSLLGYLAMHITLYQIS